MRVAVRRHFALILGSAAACCALMAGTAMAAASTAPAGHWGNAKKVPGIGRLEAGGNSETDAVSCATPGNCAAGGTYTDSGNHAQVFVTDEKNGAWRKAVPVPAPDSAAVFPQVTSLSCGVPGNCAAVGSFSDSRGRSHSLVVNEVKDTWGAAIELPGETMFTNDGNMGIESVSCAAAGDCSAGGFYTRNGGRIQAFVADEGNGGWGTPQALRMSVLSATGGGIQSVSCPSPGNCGGAGQYFDDRGISQALVVDETNGTWGTAQPVPEMSMLNPTRSEADSISCPSAGNCGLAGAYADGQGNQQVFIVDEVNGTWGTPQQVPGTGALNTGGNAVVNQISCGSPGNCAVVGFYTDKNGHTHGFTADEKRGIWQAVHKLASKGAFSASTNTGTASVSCPSAGNCVAGGFALIGKVAHLFTASEVNGSWGNARELPGSASLSKGRLGDVASVSCATPGNCVAGGFYLDSALHGHEHAFVADSSAMTASSLALPTASIKFGHEQAEKISVKVTARIGGTPGGKVTVTANQHTVCVITLAGGKGSCALAARKLNPGSYQLTAAYGGSQTFSRSVSAPMPLTVTK